MSPKIGTVNRGKKFLDIIKQSHNLDFFITKHLSVSLVQFQIFKRFMMINSGDFARRAGVPSIAIACKYICSL